MVVTEQGVLPANEPGKATEVRRRQQSTQHGGNFLGLGRFDYSIQKDVQKPVSLRASVSSAAEFLRERYGEVFAWCLQITGGDIHEAEDLIQDAFVLLSHNGVSTDDLHHVEGYIYAILRNLHRSRYERRRRHVPLPILDYDSARLGLSVVDSSHLVIVADQLRGVCRFACGRKESSRAGSVLILRFFHGYYPSEISSILMSSRESVEEHLRAIRKEVWEFLARADKPALVDFKAPASTDAELPFGRGLIFDTTETLLDELQQTIFRSCSSPCPVPSVLARWYRTETLSAIPVALLAHIVSCPVCLSQVNRLLNLPPLDTRNPADSAGKQPGSGFRIVPRQFRNGGRQARKAGLMRLDRLAGEVYEHRPESLCIAVNGQPVAIQPVTGSYSEITVRLQQSAGIDFIEVFSEQDVRLLMIPIRQLPPNGPFEQSAMTRLSHGREVSATFRFTSPWPSVHVSYRSDALPETFETHPSRELGPSRRERGRWLRWPGWRPAFHWTGILVSVSAMLLYLMEQNRYNTAEARTLIAQCASWENTVREPGQTVVRQRFHIRERNSMRAARIVEVWRGAGRQHRLVRLLDSSGRVIESSDRPIQRPADITPDQLWQFEPSAETFAAFTAPKERLWIHERGAATNVEAASITLTLDTTTHRPAGEVLHAAGVDLEFSETDFDEVPAAASPIAGTPAGRVEAKRIESIRPAPAPSPVVDRVRPRSDELERAELQARVALHSLGADLQDSTRFQQTPEGVVVELVVETHEIRDKTLAVLEPIGWIRPRFKVIADVPASAGASPGGASGMISVSPAPSTRYQPLMESYLKERLASAAAVNQVMAAAARSSDDLLNRAVAISQLAARYPAAEIAVLLPDVRLELLRLVQSQLDELEVERGNFKAIALDLVRPVAAAAPEHTAVEDTGGDWSTPSAALLESVKTIHTRSTALFEETTQAPAGTLADLAAELLAAARAVPKQIDSVRRNLTRDVSR